MISPKKLVKMARKWQKEATCGSAFQKAGHFVIYTSDQTRFEIPLVYINHNIFRELFRMSEDEFGLPRDGPIMLPCDAAFMKYIIEMVRRGAAEDLESALLVSIAKNRCSFNSLDMDGELKKQVLVCGYY